MKFGKLVVFVLIFMIMPTQLFLQTSTSQESNPTVKSMVSSIPIDIKFWGIEEETNLDSYLFQNLPAEIPVETYFPNFGTYGKWNQKIFSTFYTLNYQLNYNPSFVTQANYTKLIDYLDDIKEIRFGIVSPTSSNEIFDGYALPHSLLDPFLDEYNSKEAYTIHLFNITQFNNENRSHWLEIGNTRNIDSSLQDMRNIAVIGNRGLVFDPTAIAPFFGVQSESEDFYSSLTREYLKNTLDLLIREVIVGTPLSYNFLALEKRIHVGKILLSEDPNNGYYSKFKLTSSTVIKNQIERLLPYYEIRFRNYARVIENVPALDEFFESESVLTPEYTTYYVDQDFAEKYKQIVRRDIYPEWPRRYFYSLNFYFDSNVRFVTNTTVGPIKYEVGELGFSIADLSELYHYLPQTISSSTAIEFQLKLLGKTFGLVELENNVTSQIDSPMSYYGVSDAWRFTFSEFEKDQVARRHGLLYKHSVNDSIIHTRQDLKRSIFFWVKTDRFDSALSYIEEGDENFDKLNYTGAVSEYLKANDLMQKGLDQVQFSKNFVINGSYLLLFSIILGYYIKILKESVISKEELKDRLKRKRERSKI